MNKYFDLNRNRPLEGNEGCPLNEWQNPQSDAAFAMHPIGFKVFLPASEIDSSDEYYDGDPYEVAVTTPFHSRRIACTLHLAAKALAKCDSHPKIIDVGCGAGHLTAALQEAVPQAEISGLDYSVSAIASAVRQFPRIDFVAGNAYYLPYSTGYFDLAICNNIWEHVPDPLRMLASIRRILRRGGFLIISTPSRYRFENLLRLVRGKSIEFNSSLHITEYSVGQVQEQLRAGAFAPIQHLSAPLRMQHSAIKKKVVYGLLLPLVRALYRFYGRQYDLESTVFYLAQRKCDELDVDDASKSL